MKRLTLTVALLAILMVEANCQEIKVKKGKVTMTEAQYNDLVKKADATVGLQSRIIELETTIQRLTPSTPRTFNDSASYAIGRDVYFQWQNQKLGINGVFAGQAMINCATGQDKWTDNMAHPLLQRFQDNFSEKQKGAMADNIKAGEKYLEEISQFKSVRKTGSGLLYREVKAGNGKRPKITDRVKVHYTGTLIDGTKFDSSVDRGEPISFSLNQVIPGWTEGLQLMDEGSKYMLYIPYQLGYGEQDMGAIPAGSALIFEVELLEINPK